MKYLKDALKRLEIDASRRKERLQENAALLQFMWKGDVVESWIGKLQSFKTLGKFNSVFLSRERIDSPSRQQVFDL